MLKRIAIELIKHAPFTASGTVTGILIMVIIIFGNVPAQVSETAFYTLHPLHVLLSAFVTTAMYKKYSHSRIWAAILIGYSGTIIPATLSDATIPYLGATLLNVKIEFEVPFIEVEKMATIGIAKWQLVNSAALAGIILGYSRPTTKFPHFGHVLLSTWASLFYFTAFGMANWLPLLPAIFLFLFLAVWIPCCFSDIVFPLLFIKGKTVT